MPPFSDVSCVPLTLGRGNADTAALERLRKAWPGPYSPAAQAAWQCRDRVPDCHGPRIEDMTSHRVRDGEQILRSETVAKGTP